MLKLHILSIVPLGYEDIFSDPNVSSTCVDTITGATHSHKSEVTRSTVSLKTPNYPSSYPNNMVCQWNISVPCQSPGTPQSKLANIRIDFDIFQLNSNRDELDIKKGNTLLKSFKGDKLPNPFISRAQNIE